MPVPSPRNKILPARGDYADLLANIQELGDGEVCYALDRDKLYVREGASLVDVSGSGDYNDLINKPSIPSTPGDIGAATAAQGALADSAIQPGEVNPVYFANQAAFPDATANHGAVAHSHADGAMYFAHGGVWNKLANFTEIPSVNNISLASLDPLP